MNRLPEFDGFSTEIWNDYKVTKKALNLSPIENRICHLKDFSFIYKTKDFIFLLY